MKSLVLRVTDPLLAAIICILALHIGLILFTGGFTLRPFGIPIEGWKVTRPTILLLALVILRLPIRHRTMSWDVFFSHEATILFSVLLMVYLANGKTLGVGDTVPARYLPLSILREGNFDLDEFPFLYARGTPYYLRLVKGHYVSDYPVGAALLALPFYMLPALGRVNPESPFFAHLEKLSAAAIVALSAAVLYFALRLLTTRRMALLVSVVYALGTSSLSASSQALWQHGPSQLALTAALYCFVRGRREHAWVAYAGFPLAFAVITRPVDLLVALPLGVYVLLHHGRQFGKFLLSGLLPVLFQLWYNGAYFGDPLRTQFPIPGRGSIAVPIWEMLGGILLSPGRGLFVYSPIFLLSVLGMGLAWRRNGDTFLRYLSVGALLTILFYGKWRVWWGGHTYGPRILADLTPILALLLYPLKDLLKRSRGLKAVFIIFAVWSIAAHSIEAFLHDGSWNARQNVDRFPERLWSWSDNQLVNPPRKAFSRGVIALRGLPTSQTAPELLSASYRMNFPPSLTTAAVKPIGLSLEATNAGQAVWLASSPSGKGVVRLGWRWLKGGQVIPGAAEGRAWLRLDVFPRYSYEFHFSIDPPQQAGTYLLEIGLINEKIAWFSDLGVPPIRLTVKVEP